MADPKRRNPEGCNVLLTGAEMLVLQQNVKQYLAIRQTRPWTDHEKAEFLKLRERLVPCLIRYQEVVRSSPEANLALSARPANSQPNGRKTNATVASLSAKPLALTEALAKQKAPVKSSPARSRKPLPLKPLQLQQPRMQQQTLITSHITRTASPASHKGQKAANTGDRLGKRSKIGVFQDNKEDSKRPRVTYSKDVTDVDDTENKENMDPEQVAIHRAFNDADALRDKTNQMESKGQTPLSPTTKTIGKGSTLTRKSSSVTKAVTDENTVNTMSTKTPTTPSKTITLTSSFSVTPARTKNLVRPSPASPKNVPPPRPRAYTVGAANTRSVPIASSKTTNIAYKGDTLERIKQLPISKHTSKTEGSLERVPSDARRAKSPSGTTLVLESVTRTETNGSFKDRDEIDQQPPPTAGLGRALGYEEIQASQESEDYPSSQEETFPIPDFLLHDLPEGQDFFLGGDDIHGEEDKEGSPGVGAVDYEFVPSSTDVTTDFLPKLSIDPSNSTMKSTSFVSGVWCMDNVQGGVSSIVCAHSDRWLAIETPSQVQFWRLENRSIAPQADSRWYRRLCLSKTYACPMKVVFAHDDSFALAVNVADQSYTRVLLDVSESGDPVSGCYTARWTGMKAVDIDDVFIVEDMDQSSLLVLGSEKPGTLALIPVLERVNSNSVPASIQAQALSYSEAKENMASSVTRVRNAPFLLLATMGDTMVLWDMRTPNNPISVNNLPLPLCKAVSATIPLQFFKEYDVVLDSDPTALPVSEWPLLVTLRTNDPNSTKNDPEDQCLLYVVKGSATQLVHGYHGSRYSDFTRASSRFLACQSVHSGAEMLRLWDVLKPEAVLEFSLSLSHSLPTTKPSVVLPQTRPPPPHHPPLRRYSSLPPDLEVLSDASTLSPPPDVLSSSQSSTNNDEGESTILEVSSELLNPPAQSMSQEPRSKDWIELASVAMMEQKGVVRFSIHDEQPWVVVTQQRQALLHQDVLLNHTHSWANPPCAVHIMDLRTALEAH